MIAQKKGHTAVVAAFKEHLRAVAAERQRSDKAARANGSSVSVEPSAADLVVDLALVFTPLVGVLLVQEHLQRPFQVDELDFLSSESFHLLIHCLLGGRNLAPIVDRLVYKSKVVFRDFAGSFQPRSVIFTQKVAPE